LPSRQATRAAITRGLAPWVNGVIMSANSPVVTLGPSIVTTAMAGALADRQPTEAEREYVRARARQAARAIVEAEQRESVNPSDEVHS